jgi:hypothetical protein
MRTHVLSGLMLVVEALIVAVCLTACMAARMASVLTPVESQFLGS